MPNQNNQEYRLNPLHEGNTKGNIKPVDRNEPLKSPPPPPPRPQNAGGETNNH